MKRLALTLGRLRMEMVEKNTKQNIINHNIEIETLQILVY